MNRRQPATVKQSQTFAFPGNSRSAMLAEGVGPSKLRSALLSARRPRRRRALSLPATLAWSAAATLVICALAIGAGAGQGWYGQPGSLLVHFVYLQILLHGIAAVMVVVAIKRAGCAPL